MNVMELRMNWTRMAYCFFRHILFLLLVWALPREASAAITDQQVKDYVKNTWAITDLTDDVLSEALDTSYSGIPFKSWIKFFIVAPNIVGSLQKGDYQQAGKAAAQYAGDKSIDFLLEQSGLSGVSAVASLATWPIEQGLINFQQTVSQTSFKKQINLYFEARQYNSAADIRNLNPGDVLDAAGNPVSKSDDGWLFRYLSYLYGSVPGWTPDQFYAYAEVLWQAQLMANSVAGNEREITGQFCLNATAQTPTIVTDLQDIQIFEGQTATFSVTANGTKPLHYDWYVNGQRYTGDTNTFDATIAGSYQVQVYNDFGRITSRTATLEITPLAGVSFTAPSAGGIVSGLIQVAANAPTAAKVEFYLDGVRRLTDQTAPFSWSWDTTAVADGSHQLVAKAYAADGSLIGTTTSRSVTVSNSISLPGGGTDNNTSANATPINLGDSVQAYIATPSDVDWFKVTVTTSGQLNVNLTVPAGLDYDLELYGPDGLWKGGSYNAAGVAESISCPATVAGTYYFRVYGYPIGNGSFSTTEAYTLQTGFTSGDITIGSQPQAASVPWGAAATFSVSASNDTGSTMTYQWMLNGVDISGATSSTYTTLQTDLGNDGDLYSVRITTNYGTVTTSTARLTVTNPDSIYWTGAVSNDWSNPGNWDLGRVPNGSDVIRISGGSVIATSGSGRLAGTIVISSGSVLTWASGTIAGNVTITSGATLNIFGTSIKTLGDGAVINNSGTVTVTGTGTIFCCNSTINNQAGGVFDFKTNVAMNHYAGHWYYQYPYPGSYIYSPSVFNNQGILRKSAGAGATRFIGSNSWWTLNNTGTIQVQSGTLQIENSGGSGGFNNNGLASIASGAGMVLASGGTNSGTFDVANGGLLTLNNGVFTFNEGSSFTGAGSTQVNSTITLNGQLNAPSLTVVNGGAINGTFTVLNTLNWTGGTMGGKMTVATGAALNIFGTDTKTLGDGAVINNSGTVTVTGTGPVFCCNSTINNQMGGVFDFQVDMAMDHYAGHWYYQYPYPGSYIYSPSVFNNQGILRKSAGAGATRFIGSNSWWTLNNTGTIQVQSGTLQIENSGGSGGFNNNGLASIASGAGMVLASGGTNSGTFDVANGGLLTLNNGVFTFNEGSSFTGAGSTQVNSTITLNGQLNAPSLTVVNGGAINGTFTVLNTLNWTGGTMGGKMTVASGAALNIFGTDTKTLGDGAVINNSGTVTVTGTGTGPVFCCNSTINNQVGGVFDFQVDMVMDHYAGHWNGGSNGYYLSVFNNAGLFRKSGGTGTLLFKGSVDPNAIWTLNNTGNVQIITGTTQIESSWSSGGFIQTAGTTVLSGASLSISPALCLDGGILEGTGTMIGSVNNTGGIFKPGTPAGTLAITGNYTQSASGVLYLEIGGTATGTPYNPLIVNGQASLSGTVQVNCINGGQPSVGQRFTPVSFGARGGGGVMLDLPALANDVALSGTFTTTQLVIDVVRTAYGNWKVSKFGVNADVPEIGGPLADVNRNGVPNLLKYAFGMEPLARDDRGKMPRMSQATGTDGNNYLAIQFRRLTGSSGDLQYRVLESTNLVNWTAVDTDTYQIGLPVSNDDGTETVTVRGTLPTNSHAKAFLKVEVQH